MDAQKTHSESYVLKNNENIQTDIHSKKLSILYKHLFSSIPSNFFCATLVFVGLYTPNNHYIMAWYLAVIAVSLFRMASMYFYFRIKRYEYFYPIFLLGICSSALLWGVIGSLLMPSEDISQQMIVIFIIAGITAGGIQAMQASLLASFSYITIITLPLILWLFLQNSTIYFILGIATITYLLFMLITSWRGNKEINELLKLRYENVGLIDNLVTSNKIIQQTNCDLQNNEEIFRNAMENAPNGMGITSIDGKWIKVNKLFYEMLDYSKNELLQLTLKDIVHPEDWHKTQELLQNLISGKLELGKLEQRYIKKDGQFFWAIVSVSLARDIDNKPLYFIAHIEDISLEKQRNEIIDEMNKKTKSMLEKLQYQSNVMASISKMNDMLQTCLSLQEAYSIIKSAAKEIFPRLSGGIAMLDEDSRYLKNVIEWNTHNLANSFTTEKCWSLREGKVYRVNNVKEQVLCQHFVTPPTTEYICLPLIVQSKILGILEFQASIRDYHLEHDEDFLISFSEVVKLSLANIKLREKLKEQSIRDPLTGLYNRRYLDETLPREISRAVREKYSLCIAMLDLDFFKTFNDNFGHDAGDEILRSIGNLLNKNFRNADIPCRFGGEEFLIIVVNIDIKAAVEKFQYIREQVKNMQINFQNQRLPQLTISVGLVEAPEYGNTAEAVISAADEALYTAKKRGRDRLEIFNGTVQPQS